MTVLLVDDQISILSGLLSGLDWDALNVTAIHTATSAQKAREILAADPVDILLCDIEMPGENGLSLLRWARKQGYEFVCVFLTSHANFLYAKEAIQLGCFDYILQPARYEDIQATISRAIARIKNTNAEKELLAYGTVAKNNAMGLFQSLFSDWSMGKKLSLTALCRILRQLGQEMQQTDECFVIWGHLLSWHGKPWPTQEWQFAVNNIITEVYTPTDCGILTFSIDYTSIGWFVYSTTGSFTDYNGILQPLHTAYEAAAKYLPCNFAFYVSPVVALKQLNAQAKPLLSAKQNNVLHKKGIFPLSGQNHPSTTITALPSEQFVRWSSFFENGGGLLAEEEILLMLDKAAAAEQLDRNFLHSFWIQFQQIALNALWKTGADSDEILHELENGEKALSLQDMQAAIHNVSVLFSQQAESTDTRQVIIERVKTYVEDHLNEPINVNEVAASLFMNADYLSRLVKSETGVSLKEYIVKQKMEAAQILLKTTALPISIIASKFGYDNFSYFSQAYRRVMGVSPTAERK
ncbi:MAG: response regulator [Eubacterium sp.]|nr:response regulator [Eubacterium sp.]